MKMENKDSLLIRKYINLMESINKKVIMESNLEEEESLDEGREQAFKDLLMTFANTEKEALAIFKNSPLFKNAKSIDDIKAILDRAKPNELKSVMKDFIPKLQGSNLTKLLNSIKSSPAFKTNINKAIELSKKNPEVMREIGQYYRDMGIEGKQLANMMAEVSGKPVKEIEALMNTAISQSSKATGKVAQDASKVAQDAKVAGDASKLKGSASEVQASMKEVKSGQDAAKNLQSEVGQIRQAEPVIASKFENAGRRIGKYAAEKWDKLKQLKSKMNWKKLVLYGLAGYGTFEILKSLFKDGKNSEVLQPCVINLPDSELSATSGGDPVVLYRKDDLDSASAGHGGLKFYDNGRVWTMDNKMSGGYTCTAGGEVAAQVSEENLNEAAPKITIKWDAAGETPVPPKPESKWKKCDSFPMNIYCISDKIKEVQSCLCIKADGKFGPVTKEKMGAEVLTQDLYDKIKANCKPCDGSGETENVTEPKRDMKPLEPVKIADIPKIDKSPIKLPGDFKAPNIQPNTVSKESFYNALKSNGNITGDEAETVLADGTVIPPSRRIKYKGPDLNDQQVGMLDGVMSELGYDRIKQKLDKRYGEKYVWKKQN